jgi:hypothetical protein
MNSRSCGDEPGVGQIFGVFGQMPRLVTVFLIQILLVYLGLMLLVQPGISLNVAYLYSTRPY